PIMFCNYQYTHFSTSALRKASTNSVTFAICTAPGFSAGSADLTLVNLGARSTPNSAAAMVSIAFFLALIKLGNLIKRGSFRRKSALMTAGNRSEEHTSELQSRENLVCRLLLEKKK